MILYCPICIAISFLQRLFNYISPRVFHLYQILLSSLQFQASKTVTLGDALPLPAKRNDNDNGDNDGEDNNNNNNNNIGEDVMSVIVPVKKAPKKTVSINENVEEINDYNKKLKRRNKSKQKVLSSMEEEEEEQVEPPKRLKSILKVSSNIGDQFK